MQVIAIVWRNSEWSNWFMWSWQLYLRTAMIDRFDHSSNIPPTCQDNSESTIAKTRNSKPSDLQQPARARIQIVSEPLIKHFCGPQLHQHYEMVINWTEKCTKWSVHCPPCVNQGVNSLTDFPGCPKVSVSKVNQLCFIPATYIIDREKNNFGLPKLRVHSSPLP